MFVILGLEKNLGLRGVADLQIMIRTAGENFYAFRGGSVLDNARSDQDLFKSELCYNRARSRKRLGRLKEGAASLVVPVAVSYQARSQP